MRQARVTIGQANGLQKSPFGEDGAMISWLAGALRNCGLVLGSWWQHLRGTGVRVCEWVVSKGVTRLGCKLLLVLDGHPDGCPPPLVLHVKIAAPPRENGEDGLLTCGCCPVEGG